MPPPGRGSGLFICGRCHSPLLEGETRLLTFSPAWLSAPPYPDGPFALFFINYRA